MKESKNFIENAELRSDDEIFDANELIYDSHWKVRDATINHQPIPEEIDSSIVQERIESDIEQDENPELSCPKCDEEIESDFIICPNCKTSLKDTCHECHKIIRESWKVCPYCETKQKKIKDKDKKNSD